MIRGLRMNVARRALRVSAARSSGMRVAPAALSARSLSTAPRRATLNPTKSLSRNQRLVAPALARGYAETVKVPPMAESITEGTLTAFHKNVGDFVEADEEVASIETDKIDVPVNSPMSGTITEILASPDDTVTVDQPLFKIEPGEGGSGSGSGGAAKKEESSEKKDEPKQEKEEPKQEKKEEPKKEESKPAPKKEESKPAPKKEESKPSSSSSDSAAAPAPRPASGSFSRDENIVKMNRMRLRIAERLKESQNTAASLTTFNEVDMSSVLEMRKLYKDDILKKTGVKIGFMGLFSKACTLAMREIPAVNASIEGSNMVFRDYVDISVAVATPKGLVTPVIRNAESLDVVGLEAEIVRLGQKARDGKLSMEDMAGGTFTISNGGVFGSLMGTPIINMPQSAVLGLHGVKDRAVVINGKVESRPMMYLALTYDHRIIDGREAVTFLRTIKELVEDPRKMLLA